MIIDKNECEKDEKKWWKHNKEERIKKKKLISSTHSINIKNLFIKCHISIARLIRLGEKKKADEIFWSSVQITSQTKHKRKSICHSMCNWFSVLSLSLSLYHPHTEILSKRCTDYFVCSYLYLISMIFLIARMNQRSFYHEHTKDTLWLMKSVEQYQSHFSWLNRKIMFFCVCFVFFFSI